MKGDPSKGVGRRALAGMTWTLLGEILVNVTRIVAVACLARLLTRDDFGIVAGAMTIVLFAARLKEVGLGFALVQRDTISDDHVATTWFFSLLFGACLTFVIFVAAGPLSDLYGMPSAADPIRALSGLFAIRAFSATARALCQRELRFRALATINIVSYTGGTLTSITLAILGYGMWSLVIGYLAEAAIEATLILIVQPPKVRPSLHRHALRDLLGYGGGHTLAAFANYFATQGDNIIVGRYLGAATLGIYDRAYTLVRFPAQIFTTVAGTVLFSSFARLQNDPQRLGAVYVRVLFSTAIVLLPASAGLVVLGPEAIRILLGSNWSDVTLPFQIMASTMLFRTSYKVSGIVGRSAGAVMKMAMYQTVYAVAVIGGALVSVRWGIAGVAVTTSVAVVIHFLNLTRVAVKQVGLGWGTVLAAHRDGLIMAVLATAGALPVAVLLRDSAHVGVTVIASSVAGLLPVTAFAVVQIRRGSEDWIWLVDRVRTVVRKKTKRAIAPEPD